MKKSCIGLIFGVILSLTVTVGAQTFYQFIKSDNELYVDGKKVEMSMYNYENTNYASIRGVAEALGLDITVEGKRIDFVSPLTDLENVAKNCKDSCVMVYAHGTTTMMQGSGWYYNGYIVTAKHVIDGKDRFYIETDNSSNSMACDLYYVDETLDLAILKPKNILNIPSVRIGNVVTEGEKLVSINSPNNMKNAIDECIYSGKGDSINKNYIIISESNMGKGSSGGAIFNYSSELIGMVVIGSDEGVHYAIPTELIKPILETLK